MTSKRRDFHESSSKSLHGNVGSRGCLFSEGEFSFSFEVMNVESEKLLEFLYFV